MAEWVKGYKLNAEIDLSGDDIELLKNGLNIKMVELSALQDQHTRQYDLLEKGIYTAEVFLERSAAIQSKIDTISTDIQTIKEQITYEEARSASRKDFIPKCEDLLDRYDILSVTQKNALWKELIERVVYEKHTKNRKGKGKEVNFSLSIYPKVPMFTGVEDN